MLESLEGKKAIPPPEAAIPGQRGRRALQAADRGHNVETLANLPVIVTGRRRVSASG